VIVALAGVGLAVRLGWSAYRLLVTGYRATGGYCVI
jgi:hypothetical protein